MVTRAQVNEHLEPVIFTFFALLVLGHINEYCSGRIAAFINRHSPVSRLSQKLLCFRIQDCGLRFESCGHIHLSTPLDKIQRAMALRNIAPIKPLTTFALPTVHQKDSPLLNLPGEILDLIVMYTLTPHPDLSNLYDLSTCYRRPGNIAPMKTSATLLQTCQALYSPYWFLPWTLSTHTFYLTGQGRSPENTTSIDQMMITSHIIQSMHPIAPANLKQVAQVQIFAQLYMLEKGYELSRILSIAHFSPRSVTITIRHTDWWYWEGDEPLCFTQSYFVSNAKFPPSVTTVTMELETLTRKRDQVLWMAQHIANNWHFTRADNVQLVADTNIETYGISTWKGCATWERERWIRDEDDSEPNIVDYTLVSVPFRAVKLADDPEGYEQRYQRTLGLPVYMDEDIARRTRLTEGIWGRLDVELLQRAGVDSDSVCASEALRRVRRYERETEYEMYETAGLFGED